MRLSIICEDAPLSQISDSERQPKLIFRCGHTPKNHKHFTTSAQDILIKLQNLLPKKILAFGEQICYDPPRAQQVAQKYIIFRRSDKMKTLIIFKHDKTILSGLI